MKIIHVTPVYAPAWRYGGTVRAIHGMTTALAAAGHAVEVITTTLGTRYEASAREHEDVIDGVRVTYVPSSLRWGATISPGLLGAVLARSSDATAIHVSSGWQPSFRGLFAALRAQDKPYVYSPHGCFAPEVFAKGRFKKNAYFRLYERNHLRSAAAIVATSELEASDLRALDSSFRVTVVPNISDPHLWAPMPTDAISWRDRHTIRDDDVLLLQVCRTDPIKNTAFLIDVMRGLPPGRNYVLAIMGPGQSSLPAKKHLPSHVRILRHEGSNEIATLRAAYSAAQIVVVPSFYECFGNVVVEAVLCGAMVLAAPRVGAAHLPELSGSVHTLPLESTIWGRAIEYVHSHRGNPGLSARASVAAAVGPERVSELLAGVYTGITSVTSPDS